MASQADVRRIALSLPGGPLRVFRPQQGQAEGLRLGLDGAGKKFFTEPHYDGFPAVLIRLPAVTAGELRPIITEGWRCQAPKDLVAKEKAPRPRRVAPRRRSRG